MSNSRAFIEIKRILTDVLSRSECEKVLNYISCQEDFSFNETLHFYEESLLTVNPNCDVLKEFKADVFTALYLL